MEEKKAEGSCGSGGCGLKCGCCVCKSVKCLLVLLLGGVIGFFMGKRCGAGGHMCPISGGHHSANEAPAAPPAPAAPAKKK